MSRDDNRTHQAIPRAPASMRVGAVSVARRAHQHELPLDESSLYRSAWKRVLRLAADAVEEVGIKEVAYDLDVSKSAIDHALAERERHYLRGEHLVYLSLRSRHDTLASSLAELRGLDVVPRKELTAEERLVRMERAVAMLGEPVRAFIAEQVNGDEETARIRKWSGR